jgi:hypothetical protein
MTDATTMPLPTLRAGASAPPDVAADGTLRRGPRGYLLFTAGGWLLFGAAMIIGWLDEQPWQVVLSINPAYVLIGFLLSLLLDRAYDWLGVGPASFGRALAISLAGSVAAGVLWTVAFKYHLRFGAHALHSALAGGPLPFSFPRGRTLDGSLRNVLPLFGWSLVRLGLQYNAALREQRERALRAVDAARDARLRMLAYQLNPHFLFNTLNSIRALINEDRQRARDMVTALSGYLRYALVERPLHVALLEEEVASVRGYLAIEQVRFEERLDVRVDVEPAALRCEVPAFLLNPLVGPDRIRLVVENTGRWKRRGRTASASGQGDDGLPGGVGLANVRARLEALHPGEHRVGMEHGCGRVRVIVELPARHRAGTAP